MAGKTENGNWIVKKAYETARTEIGKRTFNVRVRRHWSIITEYEKTIDWENEGELRNFQRKHEKRKVGFFMLI